MIHINHYLSNARIAEMRARRILSKKLYNLRVTYLLSFSPSKRKYTPVPTDTIVEKIDDSSPLPPSAYLYLLIFLRTVYMKLSLKLL